jgi:hypothetical protein
MVVAALLHEVVGLMAQLSFADNHHFLCKDA